MLKALRTRLSLLSVGAALALSACSPERATAPATDVAAPANGLIGDLLGATLGTVDGLVTKTALIRTTPILVPITRSITLQGTGGTLSLPEAGLTVTIPREAIGDTAVTISVTALPGVGVAYSFAPHGVQWRAPLRFSQDLRGTVALGNLLGMRLSGGYFANDSQVNPRTGRVQLNEVLNAGIFGSKVEFNIWHFSGYMVSMD
jgi:hypothetical protein